MFQHGWICDGIGWVTAVWWSARVIFYAGMYGMVNVRAGHEVGLGLGGGGSPAALIRFNMLSVISFFKINMDHTAKYTGIITNKPRLISLGGQSQLMLVKNVKVKL